LQLLFYQFVGQDGILRAVFLTALASAINYAPSMLQHGFDMHRVFLSAPGDLEREREACRGVISEVNAAEAMPLKILLVTVGLTSDDQIVGFRSAVSDNIRQCAYFVQVFDDDWGPKNLFRKMFYLATECRDDPALPLQEVVVLLKAAPRETDPEILAFRKELEEQPGVRVFHFDQLESLKTQFEQVASPWVRQIAEAGRSRV
jgi:hypothetical protein